MQENSNKQEKRSFFKKDRNKTRIQNARWVAAETEKAQELYAKKPFALDWFALKVIALGIVWLCSPVSVVTGVGYPYYNMVEGLGVYVALIIAVGLMVLGEALKGFLTWRCVVEFYKTGFTLAFGVLLLASVCTIAFSVYTSLLGTEEVYLHFDKKTESIDAEHKDKTDSLRKVYQKRIDSEKQALQDYRKSVMWQGTINIYDPSVRQTLATYEARIDTLMKEKSNLLRSTEGAHKTLRKENAERMGYNLNFYIRLSAIIEGLLIIAEWFLAWYAYRVLKEKQELSGDMSEEEDLIQYFQMLIPALLQGRLQGLQNLPFNIMQVQNQELQEQQSRLARNPIGFHQEKTQDLQEKVEPKSRDASPTPTARQEKKLDLQGLHDAIVRGELHTPKLINQYSANINYVNACKVLVGLEINNLAYLKHTNEYKRVMIFFKHEDAPDDLFTNP